MSCPVCGSVLREHLTRCSTCPMHSGCDMLGCENCGYETVAPRSVTVELFRKLWRQARRRRGPSVPDPSHG